MLIGADIDQLYITIAVFRRSSSELSSAFQRAAQAMQAMQNNPWSGQHRQQAEAVWERIQSQFTPTINALENLTARTERFANNLAEAGRSFYDPARRGGKQPPPDTVGDILKGIKYIDEIRNIWDTLRDLRSIFLVAKGLRIVHGSTYPKQLILKGSDKTLEMAFLNPHLRHLKGDWKNISQKLVLNPTKNAVSDVIREMPREMPLEFVLKVASNASDNWEQYKGDPQHLQKTVVGTVIDAAVDTALSTAGTAVGTAVGGAAGGMLLGAISGGTLAPLGVAIGARVGGFVGEYIADGIGDWLKKQDRYKSGRDFLVQKGADLIDQTVQATQQQMEIAVQEGQRVLEQTQKAAAAVVYESQRLLEQGQQVQQAVSDWVSNKLVLQFRWR